MDPLHKGDVHCISPNCQGLGRDHRHTPRQHLRWCPAVPPASPHAVTPQSSPMQFFARSGGRKKHSRGLPKQTPCPHCQCSPLKDATTYSDSLYERKPQPSKTEHSLSPLFVHKNHCSEPGKLAKSRTTRLGRP